MRADIVNHDTETFWKDPEARAIVAFSRGRIPISKAGPMAIESRKEDQKNRQGIMHRVQQIIREVESEIMPTRR